MDINEVMRISEKHLQLSEEDRKQQTIDTMWMATEEACKQITINRRSAELSLGISKEEFDEKLNTFCTKMNEKYGSMTEAELGKEMIKELLERILKE